MKDLLIIKLGGSVITDKYSEKPKLNESNLEKLAKEISSFYDKTKTSLILIHGAGSFGHIIVKESGIEEGIKTDYQLKIFAETQRLQNELNLAVTNELIKHGLPAFPCQASSFVVMKSKRLVKMDLTAIKGLLEIGMIPVLFGVPAFDTEQKCSILSGDQIASYMAKELKAKKIIHGTNVDGIFTSDPNVHPNAKLISEINSNNIDKVREYLTGSTATDVTGGMFGKVMEIVKTGIETQIVNALVSGNIAKAVKGEKLGTIIRF